MIGFLCFVSGFLLVKVWHLNGKVKYHQECIDSLRKCFEHQADFDDKMSVNMKIIQENLDKIHQKNSIDNP
jgi:uridine kinase